MATIKIVTRNRPNKDGTYPLNLRITKDRKSSYIHLDHHVLLKDWDAKAEKVKKSHPNSVRFNNLLLQKKAEANDKLLEMDTKGAAISSKSVKKNIKPKGNASSFFEQAQIFLDNLRKNGKYNRYTTETGRVERFKEFLGTQDIHFSEITVNLINQFRAWLKATRGISERTIINHLLLIRTIYNQAYKNNIIDRKNYPFGKDKIAIKFPDSIKIGLTEEDVKTLESMELAGYKDHARNVWLVSFYFAGMRLSDVMRLRWSDFQEDRLHYKMTKNLKAGSLKIPEKALAILEKYKSDDPKHDLIFPDLKVLDELEPYEVQRKISYAAKRLNENLKIIVKAAGIKKNISMHITRHTFAQLAGDKIPIQLLQKLYRHTKIETTMGYQSHFSNKHTDDALDKVLAF